MPNTRQYRYLHKGDNEWLSEIPTENLEDWNEAWEMLRQENKEAGNPDIQVEFTEDMYCNAEYSDLPNYINVTIKDDMILQYKMARGVIKAIEGAHCMVFHRGIDCYPDEGWGGIGYEKIAISETGAWITLGAKHSSEEVEVDITEQFNQAIGEIA